MTCNLTVVYVYFKDKIIIFSSFVTLYSKCRQMVVNNLCDTVGQSAIGVITHNIAVGDIRVDE